MTVGQKIRKYRLMRKMTLSELGEKAGFSKTTAKIRMSQYEAGRMIPKKDILQKIADGLDVNISALSDIDFNTAEDIMRILFELEDRLGIEVCREPGKTSIVFNDANLTNDRLATYMYAWASKKKRLPEYNSDDDQVVQQYVNYENWKAKFPDDIKEYLSKNEKKISEKYEEAADKLASESEAVFGTYDFAEVVMKTADNGLHPLGSTSEGCLTVSFLCSELMSDDEKVTKAVIALLATNKHLKKMGLPIYVNSAYTEEGQYINYNYPLPSLMSLSGVINEYNVHLEKDKDEWEKEEYLKYYEMNKESYNISIKDEIEFRYPQQAK